MQTIVLTKQIPTKFPIDGIALVNLEDEINYQTDKDGIHATGVIQLSGEYYKGAKTSRFSDEVEVDVFAPTEQIINRSELNLRIVDFDYTIKGNEIIFKIKVEIEGLKELAKTFLTPDVFPMEMEEEIKEKMSDLPESIPASFRIPYEQPLMEDSLPSTESSMDRNKVNEKDVKDTMPAVNELDVIRFQGKEVSEEILDKEQAKPSFLRELLPRKQQQVIWSFRVVLRDDTYESIASELHINCDELRALNRNIEIKEGTLLAVPRK